MREIAEANLKFVEDRGVYKLFISIKKGDRIIGRTANILEIKNE